ncbi:hypothetical protein KKH82_08555 [Patescibacteria group bacterium]|nr:hypothetical protein [Patescibacteria group bacterium]
MLGKNMHKFSSLDDFKAFQGFFARNYPSNTSKTFVANSLSKRRELKVMDHTAQTKYIETGELNTSLLDRRINAMKDNFRKSSKTLRNLVKE